MTDYAAAATAEVKWLANSYIVLNGSWYNGSGSGNTALPSSLGAIENLSIGGEIQNWVTGNAENKADATLNYQIDSGDWTPLSMKWYKKPENNNYYHTLTSGSDMTAQTVDISGMAAGTHTLKVYFSQDTSATSVNEPSVNGLSGGKIFDSNGGDNYEVSFTIAATLSRTPTSLSGFSTVSGTASEAKSFSVTATHLNGNLTVTAPTGYEVSTSSGSGYAGSVTLSRDANNKVTGQTVYVRLKSSASAGTYNGNVTVSGGGTTQVTVALTGSVATPVPEIDVESTHSFGTMTTGQSKTETVTVNNTGTGPLSISGVTFSGTGNGQFSCSPTTATVAAGGSQNLSVTFAPTAAGSYSVTMNIANNDSDENPKGVTLTATVKPATLTLAAAAGASPGTVSLTVSGAEAGATVNVRRYTTSAAASSDTTGTSGTQVMAANGNGTFTDSGLDGCKTYYYKAWQTRNSQTSAATDVKSAKTALATPDVWSTADDGSITLNWPPVKGAVNYTVEIATDDTFATGGSGGVSEGFDAGSSVPDGWAFSSGSVGGTYTSAGNYGATSPSWQIKANATWTTPTFSGPTEVSFWYKGNGGTTSTLEIQQLVSGSWSSIETVNVPSTGTTYSHSLNAAATQLKFIFTKNAGNLALDDVTVTCSSGGGTMMAGYPATVAQVAAGVTNVTHSLSGLTNEVTYSYRVTANGGESCTTTSSIGHEEPTAVTPTLTVSPLTLALGSTTYGTAGSAQSFTVSGADLTGDVTVTPPAGVSVCLTAGGTYQTTALTVSQASVEASGGATVYVKLTGASVGSLAAGTKVSVASTGAETVYVGVSGTVTAVAPTVGSPTSASVTVNSATLGGTVTANGGAALTGGGVQYRVNGSGAAWTTVAASSTPTLNTAFTVLVTGLTPGTTYEFQAYAGNGTATGYSSSGTFTTLRPTLTVSPLTVSDMAGVQYQDGTPVNVSVSGANMMGNVTVAVTSGFEVSTDGGSSWGSEKSITVAGATLSATTVKVRIAAGSGTGAVTGTLTVSSSNAADVTVSLSGSVSGATVDTGSWLGNSYLVLNGDWYNGSGSDNPALPATLGYLTTLTLGAQVQTYGQNDGETYPAYMTYSIDSGAETTVALIWFTYNNESHNNYFGMGGEGGQHEQAATTLDLSGLSGGEHTLHVYFSQPTSVGSGTLYDDSSTKVTYNVTFVVPAWSGPNTVYWRDEAVDGHFVRQDGDGNHDPWWYQITPTVGFHNPNMTDHGPNCVIFNNNNQPLMTNDVASTVASFSHTADVTLGRTNWGAALTVNSAITNLGAPLMFKAPVVLGGNVKVYAASGKWVTFGGGVSGSGKTLTKASSGTLYLTSAVTVDTLAVSGGIVRMNTGSSLSGNMTLASGTTFRTYPSAANATVNYAGAISGAGKYQKQGAGTTTLSGANTFTGGATIWTGTVVANHATALGTGAVTVRTNATLKVGVASVSVASVDFMEAGTTLSTGAGKVLASTGNAAIKKVSFDAGNYSGDDTQWAIVTSASGTITQDGALTVVNPPATGACVLELSADNKTLYVTYHKPPAAPTLTVSQVSGNAAQLSVTATPPAGAGVVVVRNESGTFGSPTGSTLPSVGATEWAGGTVVSVTGGTFTDSGLTGCTTYYYKAWSLKNGLWSTDGTARSAATDTPAVPTGLAEGVVTATNAVLNWTGVSGAGGYLLDIAKGTSFGGGAASVVASSDFSGFTSASESSTDRGTTLGNFGMTGWSGSKIYDCNGYAKLGSGSAKGSVQTPEIAVLPAGTTISCKVKRYNDKGGEFDVWVWDEDEGESGDWVTVGETVALSTATDWTTVSVTTTKAYANTYVSFDTDSTPSEKRCYLDDIVVTAPATTPTYVTADGKTYEKYDVGDVTSYLVEGLEEDTDYVWRLYAYGATTNCASDASSADTFTTPPDASLTGVTISDANGAGGASAVAAGNVAAGQTVLVQGTKLVVASGSVNPTLSGVTFTTAGTAGAADVDSYRVKVTDSGTWVAGNTGLKGTVACSGAATSHSVTFGSAQTLTAGGTYYVWIEAVTKGNATGGHQVGVAALTVDSFTTTGARKTGGTTATGLQTIGNLTAFSAATGSAAGGQVALTWALGASGTVTVRWSTADDIPDPGTAWANETTGLTGSTGTTLTMPVGCQAYYFKAWEVVDGVACGLVRPAGPAEASGPAVPTGLGHGTPGPHGATLTWSAAGGATGYAIDLWHFDGGGASGIDGTYSKITSTDDLAEGNYLVVAVSNSSLVAMKSTTNSTPALLAETVGNDKTATSLTITTNEAEIVWYLAYDGTTESWTFRNDMCNGVEDTRYAASKGNDNKADIVASVNAAARWQMGVEDGLWAVTNMAQTTRTLKYNPSSPRFACYASGQSAVMLFKQSTSAGTRVDDVIGGVVQEDSPVRVTAHGATGVDVDRLLGTTTYYWDVKATGSGSGCESSASSADHFTTAEQLGAPVIGALVPGPEQLSGRVTGEAGATLILKRYETEAAARAGSATGMDGGVVVSTTETGVGTGVWDFTDTGLDGCTTYAYRAWQVQRIDGENVTSSGSAVVSEQTQLGTLLVDAKGAGTQMTISWTNLPGAVSYQVLISDTAGVWTAPTSGETVLDEDFAGFTGSDVNVASTNGQTISSTLTHDPGWYGNTVYASNGMARIGKSNASGLITTPKLSALANGGTLTFNLKKYGTDNNYLDVQICYDDGEEEDNWTRLQQFTTTTNWQECAVTLSPNAQDFWICFETTSKRAWLDDVLVVSKGSSSTGGLIYDVTVTDPPFERTKIGLEVGQPYYYKVIATGAEGCTAEARGTASTANAPMIEVTPKHYNFGTVNKVNGAQTATFTIRNTGNIPLKFDPATDGAFLVQDGTEYSITLPSASQRKADLGAGESRTYTVQFNPLSAGPRPATLRFRTDAYNVTEVVPVEGSETYANLDIPLSAECYDPATADPEVLRIEVTDGLGVTNTVWDESLANSASQPVLSVVAYHYNGIDWDFAHQSRAQWTLYAPDGTAVRSGQSFTSMEGVEYDGRSCVRLSAPIPALGAAATALGTWSVGVTLKASNLTSSVTTTNCIPPETGWLLDDFTRPDVAATGAGTLGNGWSAEATDDEPGSAVIHGHGLELYGPNGARSESAGRVRVTRSFGDQGYPTDWRQFTSAGSWGFHFKTGAKTGSWGNGSTAGAFVLGSVQSSWFTANSGQSGVAVMLTNDNVRLVKFGRSLLEGATITDLTTETYRAATQGKWLAVRVDYIPGQEEEDGDTSDDGQYHAAVPAKMRLFVKEVAGPGGNPVAECGSGDLVQLVEVGDAVGGDLAYGGVVWNHGTAQLSETTGCIFDDICVPHMDGVGKAMEFRVVDEDVEGPEFYGFAMAVTAGTPTWLPFGGAIAAPEVNSSGMTVTGMVHDANGLTGNVSFTIKNGDETLASGTATPSAVSGSTTEFTVSFTVPSGTIPSALRSADCHFVVTATDGDADRTESGTNVDTATGSADFPFTFADSTPKAPGWATVEGDGAEMAVLRWARSAGTTYVVVRGDAEIGAQATPVQGTTTEPLEGTTFAGLGKVVYKGTGDNHLTGSWTAREFVVSPGSTNYFVVYGVTGNGTTGYYYSSPTKPNAYAWATTNTTTGDVTHHTAVDGSGMPAASSVTEGAWPLVTPKYEPGEGVDAFAYRTSVTDPNDTTPQTWALPFNCEYDSPRPQTGSGWGGAWTDDVGTWKVHDGGLMTSGTHYPTPAGNKLFWEDTSSSAPASATLTRTLKTPNTSGHFFVAGMLNYGGGLDASMFDTAGTWVTIALVDEHDNVLVSFGKQGGGTCKDATMQVPVGQFGITGSAGEYRNTTGDNDDNYQLNPGHGQDYIIAGEVDRENKTLRMWVFYGGSGSSVEIPQVYNDLDNTIAKPSALETVQASWSWASTAPNWAGKIAGIRLIAGSDGSHQLGHVYFDEIRFANTWPELFLFNDPEVYTFDFDKPASETPSGIQVGTDADGHRLWEVSDGALAHGDVGLNAQFGLYHRTGISSASFTIKDADGNQILKQQQNDAGKTAPEQGGTPASVNLSGRTGAAYSDWKTESGGAMGVAIPTNRISLDATYTVEVTLTSAGGREATVTAASETGGGGATDLFIGEYGEGVAWDKYIEIYNGTGEDKDLYDYYLFRPKKDQDWSDYSNLIPDGSYPYARLSATRGTHILHHKETIVLLNTVNTQTNTWRPGPEGKTPPNSDDFLAAMETALTEQGAKFLRMPLNVLDAGGKVPYLLVRAEDFNESTVDDAKGSATVSLNWLDACGLANQVLGDESGRYIMSRKETATHLPRSKPYIIDPSEWGYRRWGETKITGDDWYTDPKYTNLVETAGQYDSNIGLGGNMEFKVYDDDTDAPLLSGGGVKVGSGDRLTGEPGDRTYVMGAWSFTNWPAGKSSTSDLTLEDYQWITEMWPYGMTTKGGVSWSPLLGGTDLAGYASVIEAGTGKGQVDIEFDGIGQRKYGCMLAKASSSFDKADEVWLGFDLDTSKLSDAVLTFGYAGGPAGFANARVEVSTTGQEGTFTHPKSWEFTANNTGGATTWTEWSGALADAGEAVGDAGHLWFRVVLKDYGTASGTFRMDNIRLEGAPQFLRVSDAQMNTQTLVFDAVVSDEKSGLDAATAAFTCGVASPGLAAANSLVSSGKSDSTFTWTKSGGFSKAKVQEWYEKSLEGKTQLRVEIADKDDDRPGDAATMTADYGTLDVYDDDAEPPVLEMATMKPRKDGTMAQWLLKEKTRTPSETMDGLDVGDLGLNTTAGKRSNPRYALATNDGVKAYAVYQSGWQAESKFWTATVKNTTAGAGSITKVKFWSKVGSELAPTGYDVQSGTVASGETEAASTTSKGTGSLLTSGSAWVKEGTEGEVTGTPIKTWAPYELTLSTPIALAAAGTSGDMVEIRIFGTGTDPDGIGATWYLWGLEFEGALSVPGTGGEDGYTYVTDDSMAGGTGATLTMSGNVWDEGSGLLAAPTYSLTNAATGAEISSGTIAFTPDPTAAASTRTTKAAGEFSQEITLSSVGYGVQLTEYKGGIHAEDADDDRGTAGEDKSVLDGQFAFTVVDQDLVGPSAPANVTVNGTAVPNEAPNPDNVAWTNNPEFLVAFDVANDVVPSVEELTGEDYATWRTTHGITNGMVKKASIQCGASGVGEYRVALETTPGTPPTPAAMSNAPAFSVAVTNGALANYGFERYPDASWANPDGDSGINKGTKISNVYPVAEGTNSYYLRAHTAANNNPEMRQVVPLERSEEAYTVDVEIGAKIHKRGGTTIVYAQIELAAADDFAEVLWKSPVGNETGANQYRLCIGDDPAQTWMDKSLEKKTITVPAGAAYMRFSLFANNAAADIDDVRLGVKKGTGTRATMRYVADAAAQGLNVKHLFAVDADNNRPQDRMLGETAVFYTAFDCTPPTPVEMDHETGASTDVDDPTTQMKLTWSPTKVGPDDPNDGNHPTHTAADKNILSPWKTYKVYYTAYNPTVAEEGFEYEGTTPTEESVTNYFYQTFLKEGAVGDGSQEEGKGRYTEWASVTMDSEIEDSTATTDYDGMKNVSTGGVTVYDLENDLEYVFVTVGVDAAGNEGPATSASWATNNTIKFSITRGWHVRTNEAVNAFSSGSNNVAGIERRLTNSVVSALEWTAAGMTRHDDGTMTGEAKKDYDLLHWDARNFREHPDNDWKLIQTVHTNWFVDDGGPTNRGAIRFYRASYKDRWKKKVTVNGQEVSQMPLVSEEVYAQTAIRLRGNPSNTNMALGHEAGQQNFVALHGVPYTNSFRAVFGGTNEFPGGAHSTLATCIDFYKPDSAEKSHADERYWLCTNGCWYAENGETGTNDLSDVVWTNQDFFTRAFSIHLPDPIPTNYVAGIVTNWHGKTPVEVPYMLWKPILQVPTNGFSRVIECGTQDEPKYNIVALRLPVATGPEKMNLVESGFKPGFVTGDEMYTIDTITREPNHSCYCEIEGGKTNWYFVSGGRVPGDYFKPNDVLVIVSKNPKGTNTTWTWEYNPANFYTLPNRHMQCAPEITKGKAMITGETTATVPATIHAGGMPTTVSFVYGPTDKYGLTGTVTGGDVENHPEQVSAGQTARQVSVNLSGLVPGGTNYYRWTATNEKGKKVATGSFVVKQPEQ